MPRPKVVIIEDDRTIAGMFGIMLEGEGYHTVAVIGADNAINVIRREKPQVVLLDVMMPGLSGDMLCSYIRREPDLRDLPIILISARNRPEDVQRGIEAGASVYLVKPVSKKELIETIDAVLKPGSE